MYLLKLKASLIRPYNTSSSRFLHIILFTFWLFSQASHFIDPFHHITVLHTNTIPYIITIRVYFEDRVKVGKDIEVYSTYVYVLRAHKENTSCKMYKSGKR